MLLLAIVLLMLGAGYAALMIGFAAGFRRVVRPSEPPAANPNVSVIIPARNEEREIEGCVSSVLACAYPYDRLEVLVVDDHSTDRTLEVAAEMAAASEGCLRVIRAPAEPTRAGTKKAALSAGISASRGELILTTDADCRVSPEWIDRMTRAFSPGVGYVAGPVVYAAERGGWQEILALEFLGLVAAGAGAIGIGRPILSNGANAAFRRSAFDAVGGYDMDDVVSPGDDDVLMQRIAYETDWSVAFCGDGGATVSTSPPPDLGAFMHQRLRWGSTGVRYRHGSIRLLLIGIYLFYAGIVVAAGATFFVPGFAAVLAVLLILKIGSEAALLVPAARRFGRTRWLRWFIPAQVLHIPYILFFPAAGALIGFRWKDRKLRR